MTASEALLPAVSGLEGARQSGSRRAASRPARFKDFICSLTFGKMPQCVVCLSKFDTESSFRRHSRGELEQQTNEEVERQTEKSRLSHMNSKRRRCHRARVVAEAAAGAVPGSAAGPARDRSLLQPGNLRHLSSCLPAGWCGVIS